MRDAGLAGDWGTVATALQQRTAALALFEAAATKPRVDFERDLDLGPNVLFPEFAGMKSGVRSLGLRARLRTVRGDRVGALKDVRTALRLARQTEADANLIAFLVRISCEAIVYDDVRRAAALDPGLVPAFLTEIGRPYAPPNLARALRSEAYLAIATIRNLQRIPKEDDDRDGIRAETDPAEIRRDGVPETKGYRAFMTRSLQVWTRLAPFLRKYEGDPVRLSEEVDRIADAEAEKRAVSYTMNLVIFPTLSAVGKAVPKLQADREITLAYLRALDLRRRTGAFPKMLLTGKDPFGRPYIARREGTGFRIYSLGANGRDDGGLSPVERPATLKSDDIVAAYPPPTRKRSVELSRTHLQ